MPEFAQAFDAEHDVVPSVIAADRAPWEDRAAWASADASRLDDDGLLAALRDAEAAGRLVDAARARLAAEVAERSRRELGAEGLARRLGCRSAVELLQRVTGVSGATASRRVRLGAAVRPVTWLTGEPGPAAFPHVGAALAAGTIGVDAASAVVGSLSPALPVAGPEAVGTAERALVEEAVAPDPGGSPQLDADGVRMQARVWAEVLDPDGAEPREVDVQRRGLWLLAPRHGLVPVRGNLMPDVAAALTTYAHACMSPRTRELPGPDGPIAAEPGAADLCAGDVTDDGVAADNAPADDSRSADTPADGGPLDDPSAGELHADGASVGTLPADPRSRAQQLHDVLAAMIGAAARAADAPSVAGNAPTLVVAVRAEDLAAGRGAAFLEDGSPVGLGTAHQVGCAGTVLRVAVEASGRVAGLESPDRCFTGQQRRAIALRDGGCVIPGCHVPAGWCEVHHVVPHAAHGPTHTDNGVLLCWYHHRTIETSGWQVRMTAGVPEVRAPQWVDPERTWRPARGSPLRYRLAIERTTAESARPGRAAREAAA